VTTITAQFHNIHFKSLILRQDLENLPGVEPNPDLLKVNPCMNWIGLLSLCFLPAPSFMRLGLWEFPLACPILSYSPIWPRLLVTSCTRPLVYPSSLALVFGLDISSIPLSLRCSAVRTFSWTTSYRFYLVRSMIPLPSFYSSTPLDIAAPFLLVVPSLCCSVYV